jgi:diguanylate cyclase (GGDEF)-like protein
MDQLKKNNLLHTSSNQLIDALTGCWNRVRFIDFLAEVMSDPFIVNWSAVGIDLNHFKRINDYFGHSFGDALLQWVADRLKEECPYTCRVSGDEFFMLFMENDHTIHNKNAQLLYEKINRDLPSFFAEKEENPEKAEEFIPLLTMSVVNFSKSTRIAMDKVYNLIDYSIFEGKKEYRQKNLSTSFRIYDMSALLPLISTVEENWVSEYLMKRVSELSKALAESNTLALSDQVSGLPNALAAESYINNILVQTDPKKDEICLLFIDGDDLRLYNKISYQSGDQMIRNLALLFKESIQGNEFLARWRRGDEFVIICPGLSIEAGKEKAEQLRAMIEAKTQSWQIPVTISIGLACYPHHGENLDELLEHAELCITQAKSLGKNQVVLIE